MKKSIVVIVALLLVPMSLNIYASQIKVNGKFVEKEELKFETSKNIYSDLNKSYIYSNNDNTYSIINADNGKVNIQQLDKDFKIKSSKTIIYTLPLFGGYYYDGKNHFIVSGQENPSSSAKTEIYRIEKYNNNFNKISTISIKGDKYKTTTRPFVTGGVEFAQNGNILTIVDTTLMQKDLRKDCTQVNLSITIDMQYSTLKDVSRFGLNYNKDNKTLSNMNAFVKYGHENHVSLCGISNLSRCIYIIGTEYANIEKSKTVEVFYIYNEEKRRSEEEFTGAEINGFEVSSNYYLVIGNSVIQDDNYKNAKARNVFITTVPKTQLSEDFVRASWITDYTDNDGVSISNCKIVKIDKDSFVIMWQEDKDGVSRVKYTLTDNTGKISDDIKSIKNCKLSNCMPIVKDNKLIWFTISNDNDDINIYQINLENR